MESGKLWMLEALEEGIEDRQKGNLVKHQAILDVWEEKAGCGQVYEVSYIGMDGRLHEECHTGDRVSLQALVKFLEERGAHSVAIDEIDS